MNRLTELINNYFKDDYGNLNIFGKLIVIVLIVFSIKIIISIVNRIIDRTLRDKKQTNYFVNNKRANTIGQILQKLVKYTLYFIGALMILEMFGVKTTSILATAGVGGLAIGFGAQSLVKDVITGFFIILEDQYAVGDYIQISNFEGIVEDLGMRVTRIRDFSGELHIIPNGEIQVVTNRTRGAMRALVTVGIAYEEDIDKAFKVIERVSKEIRDTNQSILDGPNVLGISAFEDSSLIIRITAKTEPMEQWDVEMELRKKIKEAFDRENIEIPYPKVTFYKGEKE